MIYKFCLILLLLFISVPVFSIEKGTVKYDDNVVDYSVLDADKIVKEADSFFEKYDSDFDKKNITTAMAKYYIATKIHPHDAYSTVQLARTYDITRRDRQAKQYFNRALEMNKNDPYASYYFANFYFDRKDFKRALKYYKRSYDNGYQGYYDVNLKIATIYEKFADLKNAKYYYEKAYSLNTSVSTLKDKILEIESLEYDKSEYYNRK